MTVVPYSVSADLGTGAVTAYGAPAGAGTAAPRRFSPTELDHLRSIAARVWTEGAEREKCPRQADAIGSLEIQRNVQSKIGFFVESRSYAFSMGCQAPDAGKLVAALTCIADPKQRDCSNQAIPPF